MITMDLKGVTWVGLGHVYQKFEALCLEVEEVMYQDTVKYVESQMQTVGASVKKFYSDVMQDLLLPSSMDPVKRLKTSDSPLDKDNGSYPISRVGLEEDDLEADSEHMDGNSDVIVDVNKPAGYVPSLNSLHAADKSLTLSPMSVKGASCGLSLGAFDSSHMYNKKNEELPSASASGEITCKEKDFIRMSSFTDVNTNTKVSCQLMPRPLTPVSVEGEGYDSVEASCSEIQNAGESISDVFDDGLPLFESMEMRSSSCVGESAESNGVSDDWITDAMEGNTVADQGLETIQKLQKIRAEESCVMVSGDELQFLTQKEGKRRLYKKKIRDAISSRMRSARKKEYEKLAICHRDDTESNKTLELSLRPTLTGENTKREPAHDLLESEWELL